METPGQSKHPALFPDLGRHPCPPCLKRLASLTLVLALTASSTRLRAEQAPEQFLAEAKANLRGFFLHLPNDGDLRKYKWKSTVERLFRDREGNVKSRETTRVMETVESPAGPRLRISIFEKGRRLSWDRNVNAATVVAHPNWPEFIQLRDITLDVTEFEFEKREFLDGRPTLVFSFRTRAHAPKDDLPRSFRDWRRSILKSRGLLWFDERDKVPVAVEGEYYGTVAAGLTTVSQKGSRWSWLMKKFNGRHWLPVRKIHSYPVWDLFPHRHGRVEDVEVFTEYEERR